MYAIIATGGKQYSVQPGDTLRVEKLDAQSGDTVKFDVLFINDEFPTQGSVSHIAGRFCT